jgi:hypothetical protein
VHWEFIHAIVVIPNGLRSDFRRNLLGRGPESFLGAFCEILTRFNESLGEVKGATPWVELVQRRYPSQRSEPFIDALLEFDLRSVYEALNDRNANLQLATGVRFSYDRCRDANTRTILDHIAHAWIACMPLVNGLLGS